MRTGLALFGALFDHLEMPIRYGNGFRPGVADPAHARPALGELDTSDRLAYGLRQRQR